MSSISNSESGLSVRNKLNAKLAEVFNVKDPTYGAVGDGNADDSDAIDAALLAMWNSGYKSAILYFPPGRYKVTRTISIENPVFGGNGTSGIIRGAGKWASAITGTVNNGFIFFQGDNTNGPEEISSMSIINESDWIASGALCVNNSSMVVNNVHLQGMICCLLPFNIYDMRFNSCTGEAHSAASTGYNGTLGIAGYACHIDNWRSTAIFETAFQLFGSNPCSITGGAVENCQIGALLGMKIGWGSSCTVAPDGGHPGYSILTVSGTMGTDIFEQFRKDYRVTGRGLALRTWNSDPRETNTSGTKITDDSFSDGTLTGAGWAGTYRINGTYTISTPIPIWTSGSTALSGITMGAVGSEACNYIVFFNNVVGAVLNSVGGGSGSQEVGDAFGNQYKRPRCGFFFNSLGSSVLNACGAANNSAQGSFLFDANANITNLTLIGCSGQKGEDAVTSNTATISNGAGGSGTVLNIPSVVSGTTIGVDMLVTGGTTAANTYIVGDLFTDATLSTDASLNCQVTASMSGTTTFTVTATAHGTPAVGDVVYSIGGVVQSAPFLIITGSSGGGVYTMNRAATFGSGTVVLSHAGYGSQGLYRVDTSQNVAAATLTVHTGEAFVMPTNPASRAGIKLINCGASLPSGYSATGIDTSITFTCLPGQAGANNNLHPVKGDTFLITDAKKSGGGTAALGDTLAGGGSQLAEGTYSGTVWICTKLLA